MNALSRLVLATLVTIAMSLTPAVAKPHRSKPTPCASALATYRAAQRPQLRCLSSAAFLQHVYIVRLVWRDVTTRKAVTVVTMVHI